MRQPLRLPEPGETWRSPNGRECRMGPVLGNCVMLEGVGYFNRKMVALTWTVAEAVDPASLTDEAPGD